MNWDIIEGRWEQAKGSIQEQWGKLTDDDVAEMRGNRQQFVGKVQERYGLAKDEAEKEVDSWYNSWSSRH